MGKAIAVSSEQLSPKKPITEEEFHKVKEIAEFLKEHDVCIYASIEGEGLHVGRFEGLSLDADGFLIIECDIDKESCTG